MKTTNHLRNIIIIIIIAGAIGGVGNYYMLPVGRLRHFTMGRSIVLGIIAAGVLPIFLKLISSNLLDFKGQHYKNYIILISFCLLTGVFADVFLQGMYRKVFHEFENTIAKQDRNIRKEQEKSAFLLKNLQKRPLTANRVLYSAPNINALANRLGVSVKAARLYQEILNASILVIPRKTSAKKQRLINTLVSKRLIETQVFENDMWLQKR